MDKSIEKTQNKILYIISMKRSGQHAIINGLCKQNQPALHYNACTLKNKPIPGKKIYEYKDGIITTYYHNNFDHSKYNLIVYNFEDKNLCNIPNKHKHKMIVITRNIYNLVASRLQKNLKGVDSVWKELINGDGYKIHFDNGFTNKDYREKICKDLNLNFTDDGLQDVFDNSESGFDGYNKDGQAQEMDVLNRWKQWQNNNKYQKIIKGLK